MGFADRREIREGNDRLARDLGPLAGSFFLRCECGTAECDTSIVILTSDYRALRQHERACIVAPGHVNGDHETLIRREDFYVVAPIVT